MRLNYLSYAIGLIMTCVGAVLLVPVVVALYYHDYYSVSYFLSAGILSSILGYIIKKVTPNTDNLNDIKKSEALSIVALTWVVFSLIAAVPYLWYGFSPINALFEATSGITTTGATILTHFDYPKAMFFWRSFTQWIGGMGIIVLFIAVLPQFAVAGRQMFFAEAPGPTEDKLYPRIRNTASALWVIYLGLTILCAVLLYFAGMPKFDAVCNAMSTLSAGGFSPNPESIMGYHSNLINWIIIAFMFFAGASFILQLRVITKKNPFLLFKSEEFRIYTYTILALAGTITGVLYFAHNHEFFEALTKATYQVISIATSTGSACTDYHAWGFSAGVLLFIAMFTGSCAGSAGAGIKMTRWILIFKYMKSELFKILHPNAVVNIKIDNTIVHPDILKQIIVYVFFYLFIFGVSAVALSIIEQNMVVGLSGSIASLGDIGPGLGHIIGPMGNYDGLRLSSKIIYIVNMLVGRLELIPFLILFQRDFWSIK